MKRNINVQYFAILREQSGCSREKVSTHASNIESLYNEIASKHGFTLDASQVRVAIENKYESMSLELEEGMNITFIPPVAGG